MPFDPCGHAFGPLRRWEFLHRLAPGSHLAPISLPFVTFAVCCCSGATAMRLSIGRAVCKAQGLVLPRADGPEID